MEEAQDCDGSISLEAYLAHFEVLAAVQGWDSAEKALQLVLSLKGKAVEVLDYVTGFQQLSYDCVRAALERIFGNQHKEEHIGKVLG